MTKRIGHARSKRFTSSISRVSPVAIATWLSGTLKSSRRERFTTSTVSVSRSLLRGGFFEISLHCYSFADNFFPFSPRSQLDGQLDHFLGFQFCCRNMPQHVAREQFLLRLMRRFWRGSKLHDARRIEACE